MRKTKSVPLPKLLKKAQEVFNKWVRERDKDDPCISCGKFHDTYDAGHYIPVSKSSYLRFHEWNVNKEGKSCNCFDTSHLAGYTINLQRKIGVEKVQWLHDNRHIVKRWSRVELEEIIFKYKT